jgi:uncharacterized membrane protein YqjE
VDDTGPQVRDSAGSAREAGAALLALAATRVELLGVELREETQRVQKTLVFGIVAGFFLGAALVFAGALVVAAFWERHGLLALAAVSVAYGGLGLFLLQRMRSAAAQAPLPFAATAREFAADLDLLRRRPPGGEA